MARKELLSSQDYIFGENIFFRKFRGKYFLGLFFCILEKPKVFNLIYFKRFIIFIKNVSSCISNKKTSYVLSGF
jgi:hypothetical protein